MHLLVAGETVEAELLSRVSTLPHPARAIGVYRRADLPVGERETCLALWRVADPGNVGTLVRTADAFGASVALSEECADPVGPKALRASAGAVFRVPLVNGTPLPGAVSPSSPMAGSRSTSNTMPCSTTYCSSSGFPPWATREIRLPGAASHSTSQARGRPRRRTRAAPSGRRGLRIPRGGAPQPRGTEGVCRADERADVARVGDPPERGFLTFSDREVPAPVDADRARGMGQRGDAGEQLRLDGLAGDEQMHRLDARVPGSGDE